MKHIFRPNRAREKFINYRPGASHPANDGTNISRSFSDFNLLQLCTERKIGQMKKAAIGCVVFFVALAGWAVAADYPPQDHSGSDLTIGDGDVIWGFHRNVGTLRINTGQTTTVREFENSVPGSGGVTIYATNVTIAGTLDGSGSGHEGGSGGGNIIATGTPEEIANHKHSHTGHFLRQLFKREGQSF